MRKGERVVRIVAPMPIKPRDTEPGDIDFELALEPISGSAGGGCDPKRRRIFVDAGLSTNAQVRELAHALGVGYEQFGRARTEVIVDTVFFSPCQALSPESRCLERG